MRKNYAFILAASLNYLRVVVIAYCLVEAQLSLAQNAQCQPPAWINDPDVPACPTSGSTVLPETAPVAAIVVSELDGWSPRQDKGGARFFGNEPLQQLVIDSLQASGTRVPRILIKGASEEDIASLRARMDRLCADPHNSCHALLTQWKAALIAVPGQRFQWQQDYFQSTFDPNTGLPIVRPVRGYHNNGIEGEQEAAQLANAMRGYCVAHGETIPPESQRGYLFRAASMGGNIEALPGGLCLHGSNQEFRTSGRHYCGDESNSIAIDVDWLKVGHVDEVIGLVPDASGTAPCNFAVTWASPKKALDLMNEPRNSGQPFFDFFSDPTFAAQRETLAVKDVCTKVRKLREDRERGRLGRFHLN